ncbi:hypothetical protein [Bacillus amyloliquefaciens]|uniref:hypothetical protein n=1 Tax=Bacillus amyloliquefaciens TaxID=1390 RepID=UPI001EF5C3E4|nr:hypothetical protein [Bacillus amyloliquefaciens]
MGVTQHQIENEFYMVDIPKFVRAKTRQGAVRRIEDIRVLLATNSRASEDDEYKQFMNALIRAAGLRPEVKFDREKFEQLRALQGNFRKGGK